MLESVTLVVVVELSPITLGQWQKRFDFYIFVLLTGRCLFLDQWGLAIRVVICYINSRD